MSIVNNKGLVLVISSPSGAGKTTISKKLLEDTAGIELSVSVTTRKKRKDEIEGIHYFFKSDNEFEKLIKPSEMKDYIDRASLDFEEVKGMSYLPFLDIVRLTDDPSVNYIIHATKK